MTTLWPYAPAGILCYMTGFSVREGGREGGREGEREVYNIILEEG